MNKFYTTKKNSLFSVVTSMLIFSIALLITPIKTFAAAPAPTNVKQISADEDSMTLSWTKVSGAKEYEVSWTKNKVNWANDTLIAGNDTVCKYSIYKSGFDLEPGTTYYTKVRALFENGSVSEWSPIIETVTIPKCINLEQCKIVKEDSENITISWQPVNGADLYEVRAGFYIGADSVSKTTPVSVQAGTEYTYTIGSYNEFSLTFEITPIRFSTVNGAKIPWKNTGMNYTVNIIPRAPKNIALASQNYKKGQTTISYDTKDVSKISSLYEIEVYDANNKKLATKKIQSYENKNKITIKNKKLFNQPFLVRMRSARLLYTDDAPVYGNWSDFQVIIPDAACKKLTKKGNQTYLEFEKIKGAKNYTVYHSTNGKKWTVTAKNVKKSTAKVKYLSNKKNYYYVKANKVKIGKTKYNSADPTKSASKYNLK